MEFHEKLQELRKQKALTQEELAEKLYVSRAAVSKWESGRGYPSIDSLKAIAAFYSVSIDELLSGGQVLTIAEETEKQRTRQFRDLVFGLSDLGSVMFLFLPLLGQHKDGIVQAVSLLSLTEAAPWLKTVYTVFVIGMSLLGIMTLALQNCTREFWTENKTKLSVLLHTLGTFLFILSSQPYGAAYLFLFLGIKVLLLKKWQ